jgi:aspartate kinase
MLVVQKYGGATLATAADIKQVALRIKAQVDRGVQVVAIVSAMGSTTNELIGLAQSISGQPHLRELDMLLSTGERVSMALLTMALLDLKIQAISFTGSQSGILTDDSHVNAFIKDVKAFRVSEAIKQGKVVVLAGFQGVSPVTKEITTLGRGGTDTTAVAISTFLKADRCEILKDVSAVMSADPRVVKGAQALLNLGFEQLAEMCFWGAKVLHYRSVELACLNRVPLFIGAARAESSQEGTLVSDNLKTASYESVRILGLNSHSEILILNSTKKISALDFWQMFDQFLNANQIAQPQILRQQGDQESQQIWITGPKELLQNLENSIKDNDLFSLDARWSTISCTCSGVISSEIYKKVLSELKSAGHSIESLWTSALSLNLQVARNDREKILQHIHRLI